MVFVTVEYVECDSHLSHSNAVAWAWFNDDRTSLWRVRKFDLCPRQKHSTDQRQILYTYERGVQKVLKLQYKK